MTPYAYSIPDYEGCDVYPTLDAVAAVYRTSSAAYAATTTVYTHFADGTKGETNLRAYLEEREVDVAAVEAYIEGLCAESAKREQEAEAKRIAEGRPRCYVTGCAPLHCMDRKSLIRGEIEVRRWAWKA